ncbi:MAG TPA: agmatinase family protein [Actinomycetota bacterium]|nr:agmatinase family protein [Actinomycetota bacterium]
MEERRLSSVDPNWPRAGGWLAGDHEQGAARRLAVLGAPLHVSSLTAGRCDLAPGAIRRALDRLGTHDIELDVDVREVAARDLGDLPLAESTPEAALDPLSSAVAAAAVAADVAVVLGGDNSVTRPGVHGLGALDEIGLLTIDAHLDLRDTTNGLTNGNPVRALLEDGLPGQHVTQVGIQAFANSRRYVDVARDAGITVVTADETRHRGLEAVIKEELQRLKAQVKSIYVDLDVDVLDRAFAPGSPGSRPGGLAPADVRAAARTVGRHPNVRAVDIVEVDPTTDVADVTVLAAASFLLAFAAGLAARPL